MTKSTDTDVVESDKADDALEPKAARDAEEKALLNASDAELVAARSADVDKTETDVHLKVFVVPGDVEKPTKKNYDHEPNIAATRQYMMSQGLRPLGDVTFRKAEPFGPGGASWALTYGVKAVPAERFDFQQVGVLDQQEDETVAEADEKADEKPTA